MSDLLEGLNPQQAEAVAAGDGPVLVLAGPGSGKTRVLTNRIAYLVQEKKVPQWGIMAVTFTNKAAAEMRQRVERTTNGTLDGAQIGTFHSICSRLLRREADATPYSRDYAIYDTEDQQSAVKKAIGDLDIDNKKFPPGRFLNKISTWKNELLTPYDIVSNDYFEEIAGRVYRAYQSILVANNAMDFDDLLMQTVLLMEDNEDVRQRWQNRLQHILVDEFQDTNIAQYKLIRLLGAPQNNLFVVGDEDQGIYAFRGADYRNVMLFKRDYPNAHVILLEQNYRSTQIVLDVARAVIDRNSNRTPKALRTDRSGGALITIKEAFTDREEAEYVASKLRELERREGYSYKDLAVMYRTNAQSGPLEAALVHANVPYRLVGGVGFYRRREIRDLIAYLRLVGNPNDALSFDRVINVPGRSLGAKSVETFRDWVNQRGDTPWDALQALARGEASPLTGRAAKSMGDFAQMLIDWRELLSKNNLLALFDSIVTDIGYNIYIHQISDTPEQVADRLENIGQLRSVMSENRDQPLGDFLAETALVADVDSLNEDEDKVTLLTLHAAKGLEYPVVFITGLEERLLPHSRSIDDPDGMQEERRLLYVGITRAKDRVFLTHAFRRTMYGESSVSQSSRFLADIPADLTEGYSTELYDQRNRSSYERQTSWDSTGSSSYGGRSSGGGFGGYNSGNNNSSGSDRNSRPGSVFGTTNRGSGMVERTPSGRKKVIQFPSGQSRQPAQTKFKAGMNVSHAKFGKGIVIKSESHGDYEDVTVMFAGGVGTKTLASNFANLVIL
jgi:DNA helicase-2/ATP-dependent DNA helicase PcrA